MLRIPGFSMAEKTLKGDSLMNNVKLSQFNIFVENYPQSGCHLVYNTLSRALIEIDDTGLSKLHSLMDSPMEGPTFERLRKCGIIIDDGDDEDLSFNKVFNAQTSRTDEFNLTLLTTYECPMRCVYCYQSKIKEKKSMSPEVTKDTANWIEGQLRIRNARRCSITYYGGEPLVNTAPMEYIGGRISEYCQSNGIRFDSAMVTSGILLTTDTANMLKGIGVKYLQITLDGDKESHDRRRKRKDGSGTFDLIMENLSHFVDQFHVTITCNVDNTNHLAAYKLIDILASSGYANRIGKVFFGPVSAPFESAKLHGIACPNTNDRDLVALNIYAAQHGLSSDLRPEHIICAMLLKSHFVLDTDGGIYTCPAFLGIDGYRTGSIYELNSMDYQNNISYNLSFEFADKCKNCPYIPICTGGCRYNALVEQNDITAVSCQREYFSYSLPLLLKAHHSLRDRDVKSPDAN